MTITDTTKGGDWSRGREPGPATLYEELYDELHRIAAYHMRWQSPAHDLQTTDLLDEAFLKLARMKKGRWRTRRHFLAEAAKTMRCVLVDRARFLKRARRRADGVRIALDGCIEAMSTKGLDIIDLNDALNELEAQGPRGAEGVAVAERRIFAGMTCREIAAVLGLSLRTTERRWKRARAWLRDRLS